jgi:regulator of sigma E protease
MKRLLYVAPALALIALSPKAVGILGAVVMIAGLIFLHELGHFLMAKRMGMPVETFSLGFGPRLVGFRWRETDVRLSALPLGGYVKLSGYNPEEPDAEDPHGFLQQPFGKRMLFYSGGILANILTTLVLLWAVGVYKARYPPPPVQLRVMADSAAAAGGLQDGDELRRIGDLRLPEADWNDQIVPFIQGHPGTPIPVEVSRKGQLLQLTVTPRLQGKIGVLGIQNLPGEQTAAPRPLEFRDFGKGLQLATKATLGMGLTVLKGYGRLVSGQASVKEIGGPVAIAKIGSEAAKAGWVAFFFTCAFISMNLAVLNALPIPFLDGGHMAILAFEKLRRKELSVQIKERILTGGFFFLITLMALVLALDLWRLKH